MLLLYLAALLQLLCKYVQRWKTLEKEDGRMGGSWKTYWYDDKRTNATISLGNKTKPNPLLADLHYFMIEERHKPLPISTMLIPTLTFTALCTPFNCTHRTPFL